MTSLHRVAHLLCRLIGGHHGHSAVQQLCIFSQNRSLKPPCYDPAYVRLKQVAAGLELLV